jgi:hypothetical protein
MKFALATAALLAAALPCTAQAITYRPQPDTLLLRSHNEFRMYFVRGGDTLGAPVHELKVEREVWTASGDGLRAAVAEQALDLGRAETRHVYAVTARGRITRIDGDANLPRGGYDVFPVLPPGPLAPGTAWSDTVTRTRPDSAGPYVYSAIRSWRVVGVEADGTVRMEATGTLHYRDVYHVEGGLWWIDVSGPLHETACFDAARGRRTEQAWSMELRGTAGLPRPGGGVDTVHAGLISALTRRPVAVAAAALLTRALPGADTSFTTSQRGTALVHTTGHVGTAVVSGMARADGMVGTARSEWTPGAMKRFESVWSDSTAVARRFVVAPVAGGLRVTGARDTVVRLPAGLPWAVVEHGMEEHLVPVLARLPSESRLVLYHPYAGTVETVTVRVRPLAGGRMYGLMQGSDFTLLVVDDTGDLLGVAYSTGLGERAPAPGTARRARADALFGQIRGLHGPGES